MWSYLKTHISMPTSQTWSYLKTHISISYGSYEAFRRHNSVESNS
ncbi:hypothetical protein F383_35808 [Gossypium arboreum]|uniref:Uncharacterized protein n=1 Tax=Gossypium arboreum TaxID=29729 RepID=A0A0B0PYD2_GOSAR|nr:hypothetical protein F383_35808 [Gossypium arboreum]